MARARERAGTSNADVAARIDWVVGDLTAWTPATTYDLVTAHYVHPTGGAEVLVRQLTAAAAPGTVLLVVDPDHADGHAHARVSTGELVALKARLAG